MLEELPCIVCGKNLQHINHESVRIAENHPDDAAICQTHGNYGSSNFDETDGHFLEFNVCDECLNNAAELGRVALGFLGRNVGVPLVLWTPGLEDEYPTPEAKRNAILRHEELKKNAAAVKRMRLLSDRMRD